MQILAENHGLSLIKSFYPFKNFEVLVEVFLADLDFYLVLNILFAFYLVANLSSAAICAKYVMLFRHFSCLSIRCNQEKIFKIFGTDLII